MVMLKKPFSTETVPSFLTLQKEFSFYRNAKIGENGGTWYRYF